MQWGALKKLHQRLVHPPAETMIRLLRRWGVPRRVLDAVPKLNCETCRQVQRPTTERTGAHKQRKVFNENVYLDEFEVALSDGTRVLCLMSLDEASNFRVVVPTNMERSIGGE